MAKKTESNINWKQVMERARRSDNQALYGNSSGSRAVEPYTQRQQQTEQTGRFDWTAIMKTAKEQDGRGTSTPWVKTYTFGGREAAPAASGGRPSQSAARTALPEGEPSAARGTYSPTRSRYKAQGGVTFEQYKAAVDSITQQRYRAMRGMTEEQYRQRLDANAQQLRNENTSPHQSAAPTASPRGEATGAAGQSGARRGFGKAEGEQAVKREQELSGKVSEQEFNRSTAMQQQYGSYQNYLRGVYAGYDEAMENARRAKQEQAQREGKVTEQEFNRSTAMQQKYGTYHNYLNGVTTTTDEQTRYQAQNARLYNLGIREDVARYFELDADEDREEKDALRQRFDEMGVTGKDLSDFRALLKNPKLTGDYVGFGEAAADAFISGSSASWLGGQEATHAVAEAGINKAAAWALRDLAKSKVLGGIFGQAYRDSLNALADKLATDIDWLGAQAWQDEYSRIMERATKDRSAVGKFVVENLPSVGSMLLDAGLAGMSGVNPIKETTNLSTLTSMASRAGGNAAVDAKNAGATDGEAILIGLENAAVEVFSEKLFGGNPVYDEDVGLINRAAAKLKNKTLLRVLDSKTFGLVSEGLEEVVAELLEPTFQSLVLDGTLEGSVTAEDLGMSFLGGVFVGVLGDAAGMVSGLSQARQDRYMKQYAKILIRETDGSTNADVQAARDAISDKLAYGRAPDMQDFGRLIDALDKAGESDAAERTVEEVQREASESDVPENMDVEDRDIPSNMDVIDEDGDGIPDNMEVIDEDVPSNMDVEDANARQGGNNEPSPHQSAARTASPRGEAMGAAETSSRGESVGASGEPEVRTVLRQAGQEDVRGRVKGDGLFGKVGDTLREYKARLKEYDQRTAELRGLEANAVAAATDNASPHQSATPTASPQGEASDRGEAINARVRELREQIAQDEAYLEAKERDMQDVASVARARLENERQQKELGRETQTLSDKELRETEQSAQAQESAAELAARKAAEEQDAAELERIAKQREYGFAMTQYFISGYFDANDRVQMDIPTYAEAVRVAYGKGRFGWKFKREDSQRGIADEVLQEAYKEGRRKGEENGTAGIGNGGERDAGMDTSQPSGRVGAGAGGAEKESAGGFGVKESLRIQSVLGTAKAERLSAKADGIQNGTDAKMFYRVPEEMVQEYPALKQAKKILTDAGADDVRLVSGSIRIRTAGGREMSVQGVTQGTTVWLTIDAKDGVLKTAEHEAMHLRLEAEPGLRERLIDALGLSREQRDKQARKYCEAYEGCYTGEDLGAYLDEIVCDAYAGINRMGLGADKLQSSVRAAADSTASQSAKKPAQTRGPPAKYSIRKTADGKKYVVIDKQQGRFIGLNAKESAKLAKEIIQDEFAGQTLPLGEYAAVTVYDQPDAINRKSGDRFDGAGKYAYDGKQYDEKTFLAKMRASANLDEMLEASEYIGHQEDRKNHTFATRGFDYYKTTFVIGGRAFEGVFNIGLSDTGATFYGMTKIEQDNVSGTLASSLVNDAQPHGVDLPKNSVRSNGKNVNRKYSPETRERAPELTDAEAVGEPSQSPAATALPEGEPRAYDYDKLPGKARAFVDQAVNSAVRQAANAMSIPGKAKREVLKPAVQGMMNEFLQTGRIAQETIDESFEDAYDAGIEEDREFYDTFKHIKVKLLKTGVRVTPEVRAEFADLEQFRRAVRGKILLNNEGIGIDTLYGELHDEAPGLFPEAIMNQADQLMRMIEVANKIQITKQTLDEAHKGDGGDYKRWAKNDFEAAVEDMKASLRTARAWAESRERTKLAQEAPKTQAEVVELYKRQKDARRAYERVQSKNLLTDEDERILDRLLRGELAPEDIQDRQNAKSILNVYEAKADYAALTAQIARWRRGVKEGYREQVRPLLENTEQAKDKKGLAPGFRYDRETAERNIEDVFPAADAKRINETIFEPVHTQQAKSTRFKNDYRARVRKMNLSRKVKAGDVVSEAHAVQLYGEAMDNIRQLTKKPMDAQRDGKTLAEWEAVVRELWEKNPGISKEKVERAVEEFRKIYDELFTQMNDVRVRNGYEPIDYRRGYFPHFQPGQTDGVLAVMGKALGIKADVTALPTTINGLTHTFKPGITWFGNAQERLGFNTAYDAVEGFDKYIEGAADIVFQTDNIQRLRAFASEVRYRTSNEGVRERVDAIRADESISEQDKELRIKDLYENAKFELSGFAAWLDEYTNLLANKKSKLDRGVESVLGRGFYNAMSWLESRAAANMVAMNPGSWLTNFIPLTQAWGYVSTGDMVQAMGKALAAMKNDDGFWERSAFLTNRRGSDPLVRTWQGNLSAKLSMPMEWIDTFTADTIVRARYNQNLRRGMLEEDAMREADRFAANIMADRSKGATPTRFQAKNPFTKLFTQFQLEVNNQFSNIFKDLPREMRKRGLQALAWALFKMFFSAWAYNELYEKVVGRRAALDPIDMTNELVGDATGYKLGNVLDVALGSEAGFIHEGKPAGFGNTVTNFLTSTAEELPLAGGVLGGGRVPFSSALPDVSAIWKVATNKELDSETKNAKLWEEVRDPLLYLGLPFGGGQIRKVAQGIYAVAKGGKFYRNNKGELQMQYPVFTDEGAMTVLRDVQAGVFGRNATKEARDWVQSGFAKLSTKETNAYLAMSAAEVKQREAWKLIQAMQDVDVPEGASEREAKLAALNAYDIADEAKALYYYNVIASEKEQAMLQRLLNENADVGEYLEYRQALPSADGWKDAEGNTVSGSKKSELYDLLDSYDFTPEQKDAIAGESYKLTGFEPWTEQGKSLREAAMTGKNVTQVVRELKKAGYTNGEISQAITALCRQDFREASERERIDLRAHLATVYAMLGKDRKKALEKIDEWVQ